MSAPDALPISLVGVYRARNAELVRAIAEPARAAGVASLWWVLDEIVPALASITMGSGPGWKLALVNGLLEGLPERPGEWLVVCDDDVVFERGDVRALVELCARAELDLAQPSRSEAELDHAITRRRRLSRARLTSFVEIGPVVVVGPRWRRRITPFPPERGMGWGLELEWLDLHRDGCRLGIVDAIRVHHVGDRGGEYDFDGQHAALFEELGQRGIAHWDEIQETLAVWRPWRSAPPWSASP